MVSKRRMTATGARATMSVLGYSLLSLLARKERTGYELSRFTSGARSMIFASSGHSNIYKELAKLKRDRYVTFRVVKGSRRLDKKVYSLTPLGLETLHAWLKSDPAKFVSRRELNIRMHALWLLDRADANALIDRQIDLAEAEIRELQFHWKYLEADNEIRFPPPAQHPLFGTYSNILLEIEVRRLTIDWCKTIRHRRNAEIEAPARRRGGAQAQRILPITPPGSPKRPAILARSTRARAASPNPRAKASPTS